VAGHVAGQNVDVRLTAEDGGPIGGPIIWRVDDGGPLLVVADGSGLVPLMAMLRHRAARSSTVDARVLLSTRSPAEVLYRSELIRLASGDGLAVHHGFRRDPPATWRGSPGASTPTC
jgi:ferredoxin-NADP reductase